jgi:hypothetical protein
LESKENTALKFMKRNWLKLKVSSYGFGKASNNGDYKEVVFYKGKNLFCLNCKIKLANEIESHKLSTKFTIWFSVSSKLYNGNNKYYTSLYLHHAELFVPIQKRLEQEHNYKNGLNNKLFEDNER